MEECCLFPIQSPWHTSAQTPHPIHWRMCQLVKQTRCHFITYPSKPDCYTAYIWLRVNATIYMNPQIIWNPLGSLISKRKCWLSYCSRYLINGWYQQKRLKCMQKESRQLISDASTAQEVKESTTDKRDVTTASFINQKIDMWNKNCLETNITKQRRERKINKCMNMHLLPSWSHWSKCI